MGYENVAVYPLGDEQWAADGYRLWTIEDITEADTVPVLAEKPGETSAIKQGQFPGSIDEQYFKEVVNANPESVQLIDVREQDEFERGHLPTAKRMNVSEIRAAMEEFDTSEKPIVLYCATGARSGEAYFTFQDMRPDLEVYYLDADLSINPDGSFDVN